MLLSLILAFQMKAPQIKLGSSGQAAFYGYLRSVQESGEKPASPGVQQAVDTLATLERSFPSQIRTRSGAVLTASTSSQAKINELYWRTLDALVYGAQGPTPLTDIAKTMPKIGGELETASALQSISDALKVSGSDFNRMWPKMSEETSAQREAFAAIPTEKRDAAMRFIVEKSGVKSAPEEIEVFPIPRMAGKEGMTVRTPKGLLVIIGTSKYQGADFAEVVLHESTHVLDTLGGDQTLFARLRAALKAANRPAAEVEHIPHVCMFLIAAEATRRNIDGKHKDVGETFGAYSRGLEPYRKLVEPELAKLYDGRSIDDTVAAIVSKLRSVPHDSGF